VRAVDLEEAEHHYKPITNSTVTKCFNYAASGIEIHWHKTGTFSGEMRWFADLMFKQ